MVDQVRQKLIFPKIPDEISQEMRMFFTALFEVLDEVNRGDNYVEGDLNLGGAIKGLGLNSTAVSAAYTVRLTDDILLCTGTYTVTLPTAQSANKKVYCVKNVSTGVITVDGNGSETIDTLASILLPELQGMIIASNGTAWSILNL